MVAAITARSGTGSVIKAQTAVHVEITGAEPYTAAVPEKAVTAVSVANPSVISCATHGFVSGSRVLLAGFVTTPDINGEHIVTSTGAGTFTIPVNVTAVSDGVGTARQVVSATGVVVGAERRYYILVDAPAGVDDGKSHLFAVSADGKHTWDDYIFPAAGAYTLRFRDAADNSDAATAAVTVLAS